MSVTKYLCGIFSFLLLAVSAGPLLADDYSPGSVILLKKQERDLKTPQQKLDESKKEQKQKKITKDITVYGNQRSPVPVVPLKSTGNKDVDLSAAYAGHMFGGICSESYRNSLAPQVEKNLDTKQMWADVQASCQCLSNEILTIVPPEALADYVMYTYGYQDPANKKISPDVAAYRKSTQNIYIGSLVGNKGLRAKCGFLK